MYSYECYVINKIRRAFFALMHSFVQTMSTTTAFSMIVFHLHIIIYGCINGLAMWLWLHILFSFVFLLNYSSFPYFYFTLRFYFLFAIARKFMQFWLMYASRSKRMSFSEKLSVIIIYGCLIHCVSCVFYLAYMVHS